MDSACSTKRLVKIREKANRWSRTDSHIREVRGGPVARDCVSWPPMDLMYGAAHRIHAGIQLDLAEGSLVVHQVLMQDGLECLGLLRTQIDALEIIDFDLGLILLLQGAKNEKKVPDIDPHLHTVGVVFAVVRGVRQLNRRLRGICHHDLAAHRTGRRSLTKIKLRTRLRRAT